MLTDTQQKILDGIKAKLVNGDIKEIAGNTKKSTVYVSQVLNPANASYNQEIVTEAVRIIRLREQSNNKLLQILS